MISTKQMQALLEQVDARTLLRVVQEAAIQGDAHRVFKDGPYGTMYSCHTIRTGYSKYRGVSWWNTNDAVDAWEYWNEWSTGRPEWWDQDERRFIPAKVEALRAFAEYLQDYLQEVQHEG